MGGMGDWAGHEIGHARLKHGLEVLVGKVDGSLEAILVGALTHLDKLDEAESGLLENEDRPLNGLSLPGIKAH